MHWQGFEPAIAAIHSPQKYPSDCKPRGIGKPTARVVMFPQHHFELNLTSGLHHARCQWVSLCFHYKCAHYELQSYQRQTSDQPAKNNGTLYQLSVAPVVPPCLATTHFQQGNQCTHSVILNVMFKLLLQWESCDYCTFWVCVLFLCIRNAIRTWHNHPFHIWLYNICHII